MPDAVTIRSADPRVLAAEVGSRGFITLRIERRVGSPARAFVRVCRSSRPHPTSSGSGRGRRVLGSESPPVKLGRPPRFPDEGPPPAPNRSIVGMPEVARQIVLDHEELAIEVDWDLDHRRQHDDKRPVLLAGRDRRVERLHDLEAAEETVEVAKDQQGRTFLSGQCSQCLERGQRIRSADRGGSLLILSGDRQSAIDVLGGQ